MIRKLLCLLLCLIPLHALAEAPEAEHLTSTAGQDLVQEALNAGRRIHARLEVVEFACDASLIPEALSPLAQRMSEVSVDVDLQGDEGSLTLCIGNIPVFSLGCTMSGEDVYLRTDLADSAVVIRADEVEALAGRMADHLAMQEGCLESSEAMQARIAGGLRVALDEIRRNFESRIDVAIAKAPQNACCLLLEGVQRVARAQGLAAAEAFAAHLAEAHSIGLAVTVEPDGVDFSGGGEIILQADGLRLRLAVRTETCDPTPTILSGAVERPAEMDEAAFSEWFAQIVKGMETWRSTVLLVLPELEQVQE